MTFLVIAGMLCFNQYYCVDVPYNTTVHITDNTTLLTEKCWQPVVGCAILQKKEIWIIDSQGGYRYHMSTLFHELLHHEYYAFKGITGHPYELIERANALSDSLGTSKYITEEEYEKLKASAKSKMVYR